MWSDAPAGGRRRYCEPDGVEAVLVGGVEVVHANESTGARPGSVLRSGRDTATVTPASLAPTLMSA